MPVESLARTLVAVEEPEKTPKVSDVNAWAARLRLEGLASVGSRLALALGKPILLHADQLEEILDPTSCPEDQKAEFLELLLSVQSSHGNGIHLVCTLRADFWSQFLDHRDAGKRLHDRWFGLSPMGGESLQQVIADPAHMRGVRYQEGLVTLIANDVGDGNGLPLLEFALTQLWPRQHKREITLISYQEIGGVAGALSAYADRTYRELLDHFSEKRIRRVLLALVRSRRGAPEATRRMVLRERLGPDWEVVQALANRRLLVLGRDSARGEETAEIAHESLIRAWPRFAVWVDRGCGVPALAQLRGRALRGWRIPPGYSASRGRQMAG